MVRFEVEENQDPNVQVQSFATTKPCPVDLANSGTVDAEKLELQRQIDLLKSQLHSKPLPVATYGRTLCAVVGVVSSPGQSAETSANAL